MTNVITNKIYVIGTMLLICSMSIPMIAGAGGISVDAGLTPPLDRWIVRMQARYMPRSDDPTPMNREMDMYMFPVVVAYGLRSDLTVMFRQPFVSSEMTMTGNSNNKSGLGDFFALVKYRAYRINTPSYTIGIAPAIGVKAPTGQSDISSKTWDLKTSLLFSWRTGFWASDANLEYSWNGVAGSADNDVEPGNETALNLAFAYQFPLGKRGNSSLAPVIEISYLQIAADRLDGHDRLNSGESILYLSPGLKFTTASFVLELLLQNPVVQDQKDSQLKRDMGVIVGTRFLF